MSVRPYICNSFIYLLNESLILRNNISENNIDTSVSDSQHKKIYFNEANTVIPIINTTHSNLYTILTRCQYKCCAIDWALITLLENQCNVYYYEYENRTQRINCLFCLRFCIQNSSIKKLNPFFNQQMEYCMKF